jgi:hypothetical protein
MVLAFHGMNVDPQRLNHFLTQSNGYTERGWLHWEAAAEYEQGKVRHASSVLGGDSGFVLRAPESYFELRGSGVHGERERLLKHRGDCVDAEIRQ